MNEKNEKNEVLREQLAKVSALVDKLGDLSELLMSLADASEQSAILCTEAILFISDIRRGAARGREADAE